MAITALTIAEIFLAIATLFLSYVYLNYRKVYSFWSSRGIPGPTPLPYFGNSLPFLYECYKDVEERHFKKFGKTYGIYEGSKPVLITSDAELISKVWISNFSSFNVGFTLESPDPMDTSDISMQSGEDWKRARNVFVSSFSTSKIRQSTEVMKPLFDKFFNHIDSRLAGKVVEVRDLFSRLTLDIITRSFYSMEIDTYKENNDFVDKAKNMFKATHLEFFLADKAPVWISRVLGLGVVSGESSSYFREIILHLVKKRMQSSDKDKSHRDLLQMLLDAKDDDAVLKGKGLQEIEVMANSAMLLGGAFDTMTSTLAFLTWRLSRHRNVQEKLYNDIVTVVGHDLSREVNYEDVKAFEFLEAALSETMRLHNMTFRLSRNASEDTVMPGTGIDIPKGTTIQVPMYILQLDPNYFSDPNVFKPERFLPNAPEKIVSGSFMPFGLGPRQCVAIRYALVTMKQVFAEQLRRYEIVTADDGHEELKLPSGTLMANEVLLNVKFVKRSQ